MQRGRFAPIGLMVAAGLSGCAALPTSGPIGKTIVRAGEQGAFELVEVNGSAKLPAPEEPASLASLPSQWHFDPQAISPGDVLSLTFYEVGVRLFSEANAMATSPQFDPAARGEHINNLAVDHAGDIVLPYVGRIRAAGLTPTELGKLVDHKLIGKSENPQVMVTIDQANGSSVIISGEIGRSGRVPLTAAREKLLDVITLAGGYRGNRADLDVRVRRNDLVAEVPLRDLDYTNIGGMQMEPGDRIDLLLRPKTYSVMGGAGRVEQVTFPTDRVSLIEALARASGPNESLADPAAVFVFRYQHQPDGTEKPVVFHVNMMQPASYLLAQKFPIDDKDVIYVAGAEANRPTKLLTIISQVFTPAVLVGQLAK